MRKFVRQGPRGRSRSGLAPASALFLLLAAAPIYAQSDSVALASGSANPGAGVALNLTLTSGSTPPASIQFSLSYTAASLPTFNVAAGSATTAASKTLACSGGNGSFTCLIYGMNQSAIANGTVAVVNATVSASASGTIPISVTNVVASAPNGSSVSASGAGGTITVGGGTTPNLNSVSCNPATVNAPGTSSCTVTLTQSAAAGGAAVSLSSNNGAVSVPASVTVAAGSTTAGFTATVASISANQTAVIIGTFGVSRTANLSLIAPAAPTLSSVSCSPATVNAPGTSSCTVTLTQSTPAGGAAVSLSSNNGAVSVPASVTVAAGSTTAGFTATVASISTNQTAAITGTFGVSQTANLSLIAPAAPTLTSVACNPATVNAPGTSSCTVTLTQSAPAGGAAVSLSSNNGAVTVPASVTVAAGSTTAGFTATVASISTDQAAVITGTFGVSQTATLSLAAPNAPPVVSSVSCAPSSLSSSTSATCAVTLSKAAPTGGALVSLSSNNGLLAVPASVTIVSGATSTTFPATAGSISSNQTATVTASYSGTSQAASISLTGPTTPPPPGGGPAGILSLNCAPAFVPAGSSATCTITLSAPAPSGGAAPSVSSDNAAVTVPAQVAIAAGTSSGTFAVAVSANAAGQTANVTATLNGSTQSVSLSITGGSGISSLACTPAALTSAGTATCTVSLTQAAPAGGSVVTISSNTAVVTVPASVTVAAGTTSATFTATAATFSTSGQTAVITAAINGTSQTASLVLSNTLGAITSLTCSADPVAVGTLVCTVQVATAAPAGGSTVTLQAASSVVQVPASVQVPAGATSAQFRATVLVSDQTQQINITAAANGTTNTLAYSIQGIRPTSLACPSSLAAGSVATCVVHLTATNVPAVAHLTVASSSANLKLPGAITTRPRQTRLTFVVTADPLAPQQSSNITVQFGSSAVSSPLAIQQATAPVLTLPPDQAVIAGNTLNVTVSAADPGGLPVTLSASNLPAGASFDPNAGVLSWTPAAAQLGVYNVAFTATNSASAPSAGQVNIYVDSGRPVITDLRNAASQSQPACSSGSVASVVGRWLASVSQPVSDLTGGSTTLGGAQVLVNGAGVPVLAVASGRIDFLCPVLPGGTLLNVTVQNAAGTSDPTQTTTQDVSVGAFAGDGSGKGQGTVFLAGTSLLVTSRTYQNLGQPALSGDAITIRVTGIGTAASMLPMIKIAGLYARADALTPVAGMAGVYDITVTVPPGVTEGAAVPVNVVAPMPAGTCSPGVLAPGAWPSAPSGACSSGVHPGDELLSNTVTMAVELGN